VTPVGRLPFPERGYVVDLPREAAITPGQVRVTENGARVNFTFTPLRLTGVRYGAVLAIDASRSMKGKPFAAGIAAARSFVAHRGQNERIGLVAFNGGVHVLQPPSLSAQELGLALSHAPGLAYGTRIFDALDRSLALLVRDKVTTGAIVLLSDGADVGSNTTLVQAVSQARARHVRVFTVGLRSKAFDDTALRAIAEQTGGAYAEAASAEDLAAIYATLGERLGQEYLLQYRSTAAPKSHVGVEISVASFGRVASAYTAPTPSGLAPFHRSLLSRFLLSTASLVLLSMIGAGLVAFVFHLLLERGRSRLVERVNAFVATANPAPHPEPAQRRTARVTAASSQRARGWLSRLERDLEIAAISTPATTVVLLTLAGTVALVAVLAMASPILALLGLLTPLGSRALIGRKLKRVRADFADQLPPNLQVLASGLRAGHSFSAALTVMVENSHEPSRREFKRAVADDQLGVPMDEAVRRVGERMASRDLEQVALLAELQRTTGGNAAEVLDVVVATVRERADVRRLVQTLTAQGRMARWILTGLPIVTGLAFFLIQPDVMRPMVTSSGGQIVFVIAGLMVATGSVVIQRIVDIEV
jgi:tight adherence protein B